MKHKLYEHIRLGAMLGRQIQGAFAEAPWEGEGTCALGAALKSVGVLDESLNPWEELHQNFPISAQRVPIPEELGDFWLGDIYGNAAVRDIVYTLNDNGWTREQIADWLEPIEKKWWAEQEARAEKPMEVTA